MNHTIDLRDEGFKKKVKHEKNLLFLSDLLNVDRRT